MREHPTFPDLFTREILDSWETRSSIVREKCQWEGMNLGVVNIISSLEDSQDVDALSTK